jgi:hypothetical protein
MATRVGSTRVAIIALAAADERTLAVVGLIAAGPEAALLRFLAH